MCCRNDYQANIKGKLISVNKVFRKETFSIQTSNKNNLKLLAVLLKMLVIVFCVIYNFW